MKIQSRDIDDLRPDVAADLRCGIRLCAAAGAPVKPYATYRNQEYQTWLNEEGKAPKQVTFHGARLAFDLYIDIPEHNYDSHYYINIVAPIMKKIGFSWMWDIGHNEMAHFQWDAGRTYKNKDILSGRMPPMMPIYRESDLMSQFIEDMATKYGKTTKEVETALETILKIALHTPADWENKGERILFTSGLTTSEHKANEIVTFGILGTMEGRRK
jgi:hypothetical protein